MKKEDKEIKDAVKSKKENNEKTDTELTLTLQRLQAEFENYKKRVEQEKKDFAKYACTDIIKELLPFLDAFELSLKNTSNHEEFVKGVELIYSQLWEILEKKGVQRIEAEGNMFDPVEHEALMSEKSDKEENTVLEELQKGYRINERVLRPAKVKVAKK